MSEGAYIRVHRGRYNVVSPRDYQWSIRYSVPEFGAGSFTLECSRNEDLSDGEWWAADLHDAARRYVEQTLWSSSLPEIKRLVAWLEDDDNHDAINAALAPLRLEAEQKRHTDRMKRLAGYLGAPASEPQARRPDEPDRRRG